MSHYAAIKAILQTPKIDVVDEIRQTPTGPYYVLSLGGPRPIRARLGGRNRQGRTTFQVMAVNNSPAGCRRLIARAIDLLDGVTLDDPDWPLVTTMAPTHPYEERGPGDFRWSSTVEFAFHHHR